MLLNESSMKFWHNLWNIYFHKYKYFIDIKTQYNSQVYKHNRVKCEAQN